LTRPIVPIDASPDPIVTQDQLDDLVGELRRAGAFAFDTEFIPERSYFPKLCLLQIATADRIAIVDPLAPVDLSAFADLLVDPTIDKTVHAAQGDLEPFALLIGAEPANVFDTQVAAGFCGLPYPVSLSRLTEQILGIQLDKTSTLTQWDRRPLAMQQLTYAAQDVAHLLALRADLERRLDDAGNTEWSQQEFAARCGSVMRAYDQDAAFRRIRGTEALSAVSQAVLRALLDWRDQAARDENVPAQTVARDDVLLYIARDPRASEHRLIARGLPEDVLRTYGKQMQLAIRQGLRSGEQAPTLQIAPRPSPEEEFHSDAVWIVTQALAVSQSISPALAVNHRETDALYQAISRGEPFAEHRIMTGWRGEAIGGPLVDVLTGRCQIKIGYSVEKSMVTLVPLLPLQECD